MISRIDHVSIAVKNFDEAARFFVDLLGAVPGVPSVDEELKFEAQTFSLGDLSRVEIMAPIGEGSFLDRFLARKQGMHHVCLQTPDIRKVRRLLDERNVPYFGYYEYEGGGWKELFIHPDDAFGVLIQIAEFDPDAFIADRLKVPEGKRWAVARTERGVALTFTHPGGGTVDLDLSDGEAQALIRDLREAR